MKMLWLLALICRDFPCIICSKKIRFVVGIENVVVVVCTQQAAGKRNPPALPALPNDNGKQPPRVGSPPGHRREWRIKKIPGGGFLALGMLPSAAKVGLIEEFPAGNRVSGPRCRLAVQTRREGSSCLLPVACLANHHRNIFNANNKSDFF